MKILWKTFYFDAAHFLPCYKGKCHNLHGHRWRVDIGVTGNIHLVGSCLGMIIDFSVLKEVVNPVFDLLDHSLMNDTINNPTAENMIDFFIKELTEVFKKNEQQINLVGLKIYETPDSCIEWREEYES